MKWEWGWLRLSKREKAFSDFPFFRLTIFNYFQRIWTFFSLYIQSHSLFLYMMDRMWNSLIYRSEVDAFDRKNSLSALNFLCLCPYLELEMRFVLFLSVSLHLPIFMNHHLNSPEKHQFSTSYCSSTLWMESGMEWHTHNFQLVSNEAKKKNCLLECGVESMWELLLMWIIRANIFSV